MLSNGPINEGAANASPSEPESEESREEATSPLEAPPDGESLADVGEDDVRIADPSEGDDQADAAWAEVTDGDTTAQELLDDLHDEVGDDDMGGVEAAHDDAPAPEEPQSMGSEQQQLEPIEPPKLRPIEAIHLEPIPGDAPSRGGERRLAEIRQELVTLPPGAGLRAPDPPKYHKPPPERRRLKPPPSPRNQGRGGHDFKMTRGR